MILNVKETEEFCQCNVNCHGYKHGRTKQESGRDMTELIYVWIGVRLFNKT